MSYLFRIAILLGLFLVMPSALSAPLPKGMQGASFDLLGVDGKQTRLENLKGEPVVLNFCAFWCDTWKAEWPHLNDLSTQQSELGFHLVAISVDATRVQEFLKKTHGKTPMPMLLDVGAKVTRQYHVVHVPTVIILDAAGRVYYTAQGYPGNDAILYQLRRLRNTMAHS